MKLSLIFSVLLLIPLALAQEAPTAKLLFDSNYVITESFDPRKIQHYYLFWDVLVFVAQDNSSDSSNDMLLRGDLKDQSFAIESYNNRLRDFDSENFCKKNSDKQLSHLIDACLGRLILRALTEDEKTQLQQYKDEQKPSEKPKLEVIYNKKRTTTKSAKYNSFNYVDRVGQDENHSLIVGSKEWEYEDPMTMITVEGKLSGNSFVMERPAETTEECGKPGVPDMKVVKCVGKIKLRPN